MKVLKVLLGVVVALIVVAIIAVVVVSQNINKIVKVAVESAGSEITQTDVRLAKSNIQLKDGRGELSGLTIANPQGFSDGNIFSLGKVVLAVDPQSLLGEVKVIDEITISKVNILAEHKAVSDTNLKALLDNIQSSTGGGQKSESKGNTDTSGAGGKSEEVLLAVKKIVFADNSVSLKSDQWGESQLTIPSFELTNLGSETDGLTPTELAQAALKPLIARARRSVQEKLKDELEDKAKEELLDKLDDNQKKQLDKVKSLFN